MVILKEARQLQISNRELEEAFPVLYKAYVSVYGSKRPKIDVNVEDTFMFHPSVTDWQTDYYNPVKYFLFRDNKLLSFDAGKEGGSGDKIPFMNYKLSDRDAVLVCHYGYASYATLIVNSSFINKQALPISGDLDMAEEYTLATCVSYISSFRFKNFLNYNFEHQYTVGNNLYFPEKELIESIKKYSSKKSEAYDLILKSLASKGMVAISSNGATKVTPKGKNTIIQLENSNKYAPSWRK